MAKSPPIRRLIETHDFPFDFLSSVAAHEAWRKEINRPIYHMHKWWAKRLGSIFRGILLGGLLEETADLSQEFYRSHRFSDASVLDPFMGSGTTVGEATKLGLTTMGRDINPVACESVRVALGPLNRKVLCELFNELSETVGKRISALYKSKNKRGQLCDVLYFFWVKNLDCPECNEKIELFSKYVFSQNAYPSKKPVVRIVCPGCSDVFDGLYRQKSVNCPSCALSFDPTTGPTQRQRTTCHSCGHRFKTLDAVRKINEPLAHRLFAKLILTPEGKKVYEPASQDDINEYYRCQRLLEQLVEKGEMQLPVGSLQAGYNTRQAMNYHYRSWRDFFNARQLLALGWLHSSISTLSPIPERDALLLLFSGVLEFNNMFASFKGEGTGAVRHMFSHHVLKPERVPLEANLWGTPKSSGSFSGLFRSRILRALDYRERPFEINLQKSKVYGGSAAIGTSRLTQWGTAEDGEISLSCGSSTETGLPDRSVDLVVTDPPFFDNVHYSELADFFFSWQKLTPRGFIDPEMPTTRQTSEVQDVDASLFAEKLSEVFSDCHRVLKDTGLLIFSYHHSRSDGWEALAHAIYTANFAVVQAHPIRAEMSVATPKSQAKEPVLIDAILVCRKKALVKRTTREPIQQALYVARRQLQRLTDAGYPPTGGDKFVAVMAQFLVALGRVDDPAAVNFSERVDALRGHASELRCEDKVETSQQRLQSQGQIQLPL